MAETTPKQTLSMEEVLPALQHVLAGLQGQHLHAEQQAAHWNQMAEDYVHNSWHKENAGKWTSLAEQMAKCTPAVEQAVAILEVLNHPRFETINRYWEACQPKFFSVGLLDDIGMLDCSAGATVLEALLKAHEAIKARPQVSEGQAPDA